MVVTGLFAFFQRQLIRRGVNLAQVVDAGIHLRGGAGLHEVGNGDRCQQADNGHDNHDFHQCEACLAEGFGIFHLYFSFRLLRREQCNRRVTMITTLFTDCLLQPQLDDYRLAPAVPKPNKNASFVFGRPPIQSGALNKTKYKIKDSTTENCVVSCENDRARFVAMSQLETPCRIFGQDARIGVNGGQFVPVQSAPSPLASAFIAFRRDESAWVMAKSVPVKRSRHRSRALRLDPVSRQTACAHRRQAADSARRRAMPESQVAERCHRGDGRHAHCRSGEKILPGGNDAHRSSQRLATVSPKSPRAAPAMRW